MIFNREGTRKLLIGLSIGIIICLIIGYALFASHSFISGPEILITAPVPGSTLSTSTAQVTGVALRIQDLSMNGRPILIDNKGNFSETLLLYPGYNVALFSATDKFNRTSEYKLELVYQK